MASSAVGTRAVWMLGGEACVVLVHHGLFPLSTRLLVEPIIHGPCKWPQGCGMISRIVKFGEEGSMAAIIFDSKSLVARMTAELQSEAAQFRKQHHRSARLAQIIAGHDGAAEVYSRQLVRACRTIGLGCSTLAYPFEVEEEELRAEVATLSKDENNDGVLLLLPLPAHI